MDTTSIKALTFDVFGTVVDWRGSIVRECESSPDLEDTDVDWAVFADTWRAGYEPSMDKVRKGELPWMNIDELHRLILDELLDRFEITGLNEEHINRLHTVWHRLSAWPDVVSGLEWLRRKYTVATLSNGNVELLRNMAEYSGLPWDRVLSSELAGHYKPDPEVYLRAAESLGLAPSQIMMVAAHNSDLLAAKSVGFRTAFVCRPREYGPDQRTDLNPDSSIEVVAEDFESLAEILGA